MKTRYLIPCFLLLMGLSSCNDEKENAIELNKVYTFSTIQSGSIKVFTKNGEITDPQARAKALKRMNEVNFVELDFEFFEENSQVGADKLSTIRFENDFAFENSDGSTRQATYSITNDFVRIVSTDTLVLMSIGPGAGIYFEELGVHQPQYRVIVPVPGMSHSLVKMLSENYGRIVNGGIDFPVITYFYLKNLSGEFGENLNIMSGILNNEFNKEIYKQLSVQDTLFIQECRYKFR